ncbi:hypothetical protein JL101_035365 (plasmid) [Skermanella rosea]|uniref:hypothetical protein n=1 Tax=Skermanella rosea TaxID=1817965 RepID=UPI00193197DF|nr:hypothetical protein [Skermanella rosea]UEM08078.1 hypothetical protein JL101_035365 [Skermanella rosea]
MPKRPAFTIRQYRGKAEVWMNGQKLPEVRAFAIHGYAGEPTEVSLTFAADSIDLTDGPNGPVSKSEEH